MEIEPARRGEARVEGNRLRGSGGEQGADVGVIRDREEGGPAGAGVAKAVEEDYRGGGRGLGWNFYAFAASEHGGRRDGARRSGWN